MHQVDTFESLTQYTISMRRTAQRHDRSVDYTVQDTSTDTAKYTSQKASPLTHPMACRVQTHRFRPGLVLTIRNCHANAPVCTRFHIKQAPVLFGFLVRGANRCTYTSGKLKNRTFTHTSGSNGIRYLPDSAGHITHLAGPHRNDHQMSIVNIMIAPEILAGYLQGIDLPLAMRNVLCAPGNSWLYWQGKDTPVKRAILDQIIRCGYSGPMQAMFLESKALELLSCQLDDYVRSQNNSQPPLPALSRADIGRIKTARDMLVSDLENPPSIADLARQVGLNTSKLKQGFRQVFDDSVFGYFRSHRLEKARQLLDQGDHNVTQAAMSIGYNSLSHFSRAFSRRFGLTPKAYLCAQRRKIG
jgi:AraC-like DNA-binding protein